MDLINQVSAETGVPADVIAAIMDTEGSGAGSTSPAGAKGLMQVMPFHYRPGEDPYDPLTSIRQGARVLNQNYQRSGNWTTAAGDYFGRGGPDAGGMVDSRYEQIFNQNRQKYTSSSRDMQRVPLGGPGASPSPLSNWEPVALDMQDVIDLGPPWERTMEQVRTSGTEAFNETSTSAGTMGTGVVSAVNVATGSIQTLGTSTVTMLTDSMGSTVAVVQDATGQVTGQYQQMADGTTATVTQMGDRVTTSFHELDGSVLAVTTEMGAGIVSQYLTTGAAVVASTDATNAAVTASTETTGAATVASTTTSNAAIAENWAATGAGVVANHQQVAGTIVTTLTTLAGDSLSIVADQNGQILTHYEVLGEGVTATVSQLGSEQITTFHEASGETINVVTDMAGNIIRQYRSTIAPAVEAGDAVSNISDAIKSVPVLDTKDTVKNLEKVTKAAQKAASAIHELGQNTDKKKGSSSSSGKKASSGKDDDNKDRENEPGGERGFATGGIVYSPETVRVAERGPEAIIPLSKLASGGDIYVTVEVNGSLLANRRDIEEAVVVGLEAARARGRL